jgi:hypothetical protein
MLPVFVDIYLDMIKETGNLVDAVTKVHTGQAIHRTFEIREQALGKLSHTTGFGLGFISDDR